MTAHGNLLHHRGDHLDVEGLDDAALGDHVTWPGGGLGVIQALLPHHINISVLRRGGPLARGAAITCASGPLHIAPAGDAREVRDALGRRVDGGPDGPPTLPVRRPPVRPRAADAAGSPLDSGILAFDLRLAVWAGHRVLVWDDGGGAHRVARWCQAAQVVRPGLRVVWVSFGRASAIDLGLLRDPVLVRATAADPVAARAHAVTVASSLARDLVARGADIVLVLDDVDAFAAAAATDRRALGTGAAEAAALAWWFDQPTDTQAGTLTTFSIAASDTILARRLLRQLTRVEWHATATSDLDGLASAPRGWPHDTLYPLRQALLAGDLVASMLQRPVVWPGELDPPTLRIRQTARRCRRALAELTDPLVRPIDRHAVCALLVHPDPRLDDVDGWRALARAACEDVRANLPDLSARHTRSRWVHQQDRYEIAQRVAVFVDAHFARPAHARPAPPREPRPPAGGVAG